MFCLSCARPESGTAVGPGCSAARRVPLGVKAAVSTGLRALGGCCWAGPGLGPGVEDTAT